MLSVYPEFLGFNANLYYIVLRKDDNQTAAYNCMVNLSGLVFGCGIAFSIICRTRINILIGIERYQVAKNFFKFFVAVNFLSGVLLGLVMCLSREYLARTFSDSTEEVKHRFFKLLQVAAVFSGPIVSLNTVFVGMKTIGKVSLLLSLTVVIPMGGSILLGYAIYKQDLYCDAQFLNYMGLITLLTAACLAISLRSDWSKILKQK